MILIRALESADFERGFLDCLGSLAPVDLFSAGSSHRRRRLGEVRSCRLRVPSRHGRAFGAPALPEPDGEPSVEADWKRWCAEGLKGEEGEIERRRIGRRSDAGNKDGRFARGAGVTERRRGT